MSAKGCEQMVQVIGPAARVPGATRMRRGQAQMAGARLVPYRPPRLVDKRGVGYPPKRTRRTPVRPERFASHRVVSVGHPVAAPHTGRRGPLPTPPQETLSQVRARAVSRSTLGRLDGYPTTWLLAGSRRAVSTRRSTNRSLHAGAAFGPETDTSRCCRMPSAPHQRPSYSTATS